MGTRYTDFYSQFEAMIDTVAHDSDPVQRLENLHRLHKDMSKVFIAARNEAAYDLRVQQPLGEASRLTGISRERINYWCYQHMRRHGLSGGLKRLKRIDLTGAPDITTIRGEQTPT